MVSGHGANLIFFNKESKEWTSRTLAGPPAPTFPPISFLLYPTPTPPQSGRHMCITPNLECCRKLYFTYKATLCSKKVTFAVVLSTKNKE